MTARTVVTVGTFDGVHRGHQAVLAEIARRARDSGGRSVLVTFDQHPLEVVNPQAAPPLLTLPEEKRIALAASGLDEVAFVPFTPALQALSLALPVTYGMAAIRAATGGPSSDAAQQNGTVSRTAQTARRFMSPPGKGP